LFRLMRRMPALLGWPYSSSSQKFLGFFFGVF
jgi:hypothetical protein